MDEDKLVCQIDSAGQKRDVTVINESGLYALIFGSKLESAKRFKHWVTSEVLPAIRKTGSYQNPMTTDQKIQLLAQGNVELTEKVNAIDKDLQEFKQDIPLLALECQRITTFKLSNSSIYILICAHSSGKPVISVFTTYDNKILHTQLSEPSFAKIEVSGMNVIVTAQYTHIYSLVKVS